VFSISNAFRPSFIYVFSLSYVDLMLMHFRRWIFWQRWPIIIHHVANKGHRRNAWVEICLRVIICSNLFRRRTGTTLPWRHRDVGIPWSWKTEVQWDAVLLMLQVQCRMKAEISSFPSTTFIVAAPSMVPMWSNPLMKHPFACFVEVDGLEQHNRAGSFSNAKEGEHVTAILHSLQRKMIGSNNCTMQNRDPLFPGIIIHVIIAPTANGINVQVSYVDSSQGSEAS
jgi:hypothetical protein